MKISICIPQFNRIEYLIRSLDILQNQDYSNFEVIISDDCSSDSTREIIADYQKKTNYPIIYFRFSSNQGYDRNLRKSIELANGDYCFILGNDDTLAHNFVLKYLVKHLEEFHYPDLGFCNYAEYLDPKDIMARASSTGVLGSGPDIAIRYYSCFSFVAGLIFKKSTFNDYNTDFWDKSIYSQIALMVSMVSKGANLFSINEVYVLKDIVVNITTKSSKSNSYRDFINRDFFKIQPANGGLVSVSNVVLQALEFSGELNFSMINRVYKKILWTTYPYWFMDYKSNRALPASIGLFIGLQPFNLPYYVRLSLFDRFIFLVAHYVLSFILLLTPTFLFLKIKASLYAWLKKKS